MHVIIENAFSTAECAAIRALAPERMDEATLWNGTEYGVNHASRRGALAAIERGSAGEWLFARVDTLFAAAADRLGVEAAPIREGLQLLRYDENCHFQQWHSDAGLDAIDRRFLSASIELSAPDDYAGGDLEVVPFLMGPRRRALGSAQVFHSRLLHRVTPVTSGTRWALVAWTGAAAG